MDEVQILVLVDGSVLITGIGVVTSELGEPDCKLTKPYQIVDGTLVKWLKYYTDDDSIMITSDKIMTIVDPKQSLFDDYSALIK
jgi:hypothetical protein